MTVFELYRGEISALLGALFTAIGNAVFKRASEDMEIVAISLIRSLLGFFYFTGLVLVVRDLTVILSLRSYIVLMLVVSVVCNIVVGDTAYLKAQQCIGVSRAAPINRLKPLFTLFAAYFLLGEPLTERILSGVLLVIGGVYFITQPATTEWAGPLELGHRKLGFGLAVLSALAQAGGVLALRVAVSEMDAISTNSVRYAIAFLFLSLIGSWKGSVRRIEEYSRQTLKLVVIATVFTIMLGSLLWVDSVKYAGASKATTLGSISPLFALPISIVFLGEPVSWKTILGTLMVIVGIWFIV